MTLPGNTDHESEPICKKEKTSFVREIYLVRTKNNKMLLSSKLLIRNYSSTRNILVINCGSSSVKFQITNPVTQTTPITGIAERLSTSKAVIKLKSQYVYNKQTIGIPDSDHKRACDHIYDLIKDYDIKAIGHRVVHGGDKFKKSVIIDQDVKHEIQRLFPLAPLHNPKNLMGIELMQMKFPELKQVAVFDTSFHVASIPSKAFRYAVPQSWYNTHKVRRYGFHGTSHKYVAEQAAKILDKPLDELKLITAHLGNGCSLAAIKNGKSLDTSMGFSPLEGLIMGSRSGDIDANVVNYMTKNLDCKADEVIRILNHQSGFGAIAGVADSRDLEDLYFKGDEYAILAIEMFCYRIAKYMASYFVPLEGLPDAIIFTAGIGERSPLKRALIINHIKSFGFILDEKSNEQNEMVISKNVPNVLVIPTNEELIIAQETYDLTE